MFRVILDSQNNCFLVWSITTFDEKIRRLVKRGTQVFSMSTVITYAGALCGVNIDPILPLITDSSDHVHEIID